MSDKSIKLKRTESLLSEIVPQALSSLNDNRINSLTITDIDCKRGKYDATIFFDASDFSKEEVKVILHLLKKASSYMQSYCLNLTSWYKCPNFHFQADYELSKKNRLDEIFYKIKQERDELSK